MEEMRHCIIFPHTRKSSVSFVEDPNMYTTAFVFLSESTPLLYVSWSACCPWSSSTLVCCRILRCVAEKLVSLEDTGLTVRYTPPALVSSTATDQ